MATSAPNPLALAKRLETRILELRGATVLLDQDLAPLYSVSVGQLNQAVKRNPDRFPDDFMFQLAPEEWSALRSQSVISKTGRGGRRYPPYAFTEHGAVMAATILNSKRAVDMSILVVRAFVRLRSVLTTHEGLARKLNRRGSGAARLQTSAPVSQAVAGRGRVVPSVSTLFREAIGNRNKVEIKYAGERTLGGINRVIHPYQLLEQQGHTYIVAWCELAEGWRHFRADRIIDALLSDDHYAPRADFQPAGDSFSPPAEGVTPVEVRFSPAIARWLRERHPEAESQPDGSVMVTYLVASPEWLVRHVLQYGAEAEVIAPASFREMMRQQVG